MNLAEKKQLGDGICTLAADKLYLCGQRDFINELPLHARAQCSTTAGTWCAERQAGTCGAKAGVYDVHRG
jgi:hypothetical protein